MRRAMRLVFFVLLSLGVGASLRARQVAPDSVAAAQPVEAPAPGRISGNVLFKGKKPEGTRYDFQGAERARCGTFKRLYDVRVSDASRLRGVVLWLDGVDAEAEPAAVERTLTMRRCEIQPRTLDATVGDTLVLSNRDGAPFEPLLRWLQSAESSDPRRRPRRMWIPHKEQKLAVPLRQSGLLEIRDAGGAAWQTSWLRIFEHPFHVLSDDRGAFAFEGVPPGTYVLRAWDAKLGEARLTVDVLPAKTSYINVSYGPEGALSTPPQVDAATTPSHALDKGSTGATPAVKAAPESP